MSNKIFVILVHGTFALKSRKTTRLIPRWIRKLFKLSILPEPASWVKKGSKFRTGINKILENKIKFKISLWSGGNSHKAREDGSTRLKRRISTLKKVYPDSKIFIVGHSHGGSIAFLACNDLKTKEKVDGVVTLSTPFLHFTENLRSAKILNSFPFAILLAISVYIDVKYQLTWEISGFSITGIITPISIIISHFGYKALEKREYDSFHLLAENYYKNTPERSLIIRSVGDEASGLLGMASFVQWTLLVLQSKASFLPNKIEKKMESYSLKQKVVFNTSYLLLILIAMYSSYLIFGYLNNHYEESISYMTKYNELFPYELNPNFELLLLSVALILLTPLFLFYLPLLLLFVIVPIRYILLFSYGNDVPLKWPYLRATAESTPPGGSWDLHLLTPEITDSSTETLRHNEPYNSKSDRFTEPMRHSEAYNSQEGIKRTANWINLVINISNKKCG